LQNDNYEQEIFVLGSHIYITQGLNSEIYKNFYLQIYDIVKTISSVTNDKLFLNFNSFLGSVSYSRFKNFKGKQILFYPDRLLLDVKSMKMLSINGEIKFIKKASDVELTKYMLSVYEHDYYNEGYQIRVVDDSLFINKIRQFFYQSN